MTNLDSNIADIWNSGPEKWDHWRSRNTKKSNRVKIPDLSLSENKSKGWIWSHLIFSEIDIDCSKISDVTAINSEFEYLLAEDSRLENVRIKSSQIDDLRFKNCTVLDISFEDCTIETLLMKNCIISELLMPRTVEDASFSHSTLIRSRFFKTVLPDCSFHSASIERCIFKEARLECTNFTNIDVSGTDFSKSEICFSYLSGRFSKCLFEQAIFSGTAFGQEAEDEDEKPDSVTFTNCNFKKADFTDIIPRAAKFVRCDLRGAIAVAGIPEFTFRDCTWK